MKRPLLDIVREILSEMDSGDVSSIGDTDEALQVAMIVRSCFYEIISNRNWPHLQKLTTLDHSGNINLPTHLRLPTNFKELKFLKYDVTKTDGSSYEQHEIKYLYPDEFLRITSSRNINTPNTILVTDPGGTKLAIKDNAAPRYWTSFDDQYLVLDSYNKEVDDTLKSSKTQALVVTDPVFIMEDDAVPDLPSEAFSSLIEESKSTAFFALKQMANEKSEQKARRQTTWLARKAWQAHGGVRYPNYGRKGRR